MCGGGAGAVSVLTSSPSAVVLANSPSLSQMPERINLIVFLWGSWFLRIQWFGLVALCLQAA